MLWTLLFLLAPSDPLQSIEALLERGDYAQATTRLEAIGRSQAVPELYVMLAVARLNLDDAAGAVHACERGWARFPRSVRIAGYCAELVVQTLPAAEAQARLERAPQLPPVMKALGKLLLDSKADSERAGKLLAAARQAMPNDAEAQYLYGRWACLHQQEQTCVEALNNSLRLSDPSNAAAAVLANGMIAVASERLERSADARAAYERALAAWRKLDPPAAEVPYQYVRFLLGQSDDAAARRVNSEIIARSPAFSAAHLEEAKFLFRERRIEAALAEANLALQTAPADKTQLRAIHAFLIKAYAAAGRGSEAAPHQRWVDGNP